MPTDVAEINRKLIEDIFRIYTDAELQMLEKVAKRVKRGATEEGWNEIKLKDMVTLNEEVKKLLEDTGKLSKGHLNKGLINAYKKGIDGASLDFDKMKAGKIPKTALMKVNIPLHLQRLLLESHNMVDRASIQILRNTQDVYRDVMAEATTGVLTGVETRMQASQNALNKFASKGITGFVDRAGRNWELASYVEMATRTASAHAALQGHVDRCLELDWDLMIVSSHANTCPLCAPWGGKPLSISGKTPGYDTLDMAQSEGLFHPNCKHTMSVYLPFIDEPEDHVHDRGHDPEMYEATQQQRYNERQIRRWKRVDAVALTPAEKVKSQNQIRKWQAIQREHVKKYNLKRKYSREGIKSRVGVADKAKDDLM